MNTAEIHRLRKKFITVSMLAVFLVLLFIGLTISLISYTVYTSSIRNALNGLASSGAVPFAPIGEREGFQPGGPTMMDAFSPSFRQNHFFIFTHDGSELTLVNTNAIGSSDDDEQERSTALEYAGNIESSDLRSRAFGNYGSYYFTCRQETDGTLKIVLLDCANETRSFLQVVVTTALTSILALLITLVLVIVFSGRVIRPEIENSNRQREFITNASHELKTPLAVIRANTELLELTGGENEWTQSTLHQVDHMNGLIQNLVMIARAAEREDRADTAEINATKAVNETVSTYDALAANTGRTIVRRIQEDVILNADESKIRQLATILLDNAIKYCDEGGEITVELTQPKKSRDSLRLAVSNSYAEGASVDFNRFFDRFYREDKSHNSAAGGYGIGLSIAESICRRYGGSIRASWKAGVISFVCNLKSAN